MFIFSLQQVNMQVFKTSRQTSLGRHEAPTSTSGELEPEENRPTGTDRPHAEGRAWNIELGGHELHFAQDVGTASLRHPHHGPRGGGGVKALNKT